MNLQIVAENGKELKLSNEDPKAFFKSIASIPKEVVFQEKILNYFIQVDDDMVHAWAPCEFYVNGKLNHKGLNAFPLLRVDNNKYSSWKIIHLIDIKRK